MKTLNVVIKNGSEIIFGGSLMNSDYIKFPRFQKFKKYEDFICALKEGSGCHSFYLIRGDYLIDLSSGGDTINVSVLQDGVKNPYFLFLIKKDKFISDLASPENLIDHIKFECYRFADSLLT